MQRTGGKSSEQGFSLVELLVVISILGVLAAATIPVFVHQQSRAADASVKSDLRLVASAVLALGGDDDGITKDALLDGLRLSSGNVIAVHLAGEHWCLVGRHTPARGGTQNWVYDSTDGLRGTSAPGCSGDADFVLP